MSSPRTRRRLVIRLSWQAAVLAAVVALAVALAANPSGAVFTAQTANGADQVSSAASFCTSPGGTTMTPSADTSTYESNPSTNYGTNTKIGTISAPGANARAFLRFTLPALPAYCRVTAATLKLYANTVMAGETIDAYQVDPAAPSWTETGLTWNNQPGTTGTAVGSASLSAVGWQQWTVTGLVTALYSGANNGFLLRDRTEGAASGAAEYYDSREGTNKPQLVLTWG